MKATHYLFVYGTLQSGYHNNAVMTAHGGKATLFGKAKTVSKYALMDHGIPFVIKPEILKTSLTRALLWPRVEEKFLGHVEGELWSVDDASLRSCDRLEGHPRNYCREKVEVEKIGGPKVEAWLYFYPHMYNNVTMPFLKANFEASSNGCVRWRDGL